MTSIDRALSRICEGHHLSHGEAHDVFSRIMDGDLSETAVAGILVGLHAKGEACDELVGAARAMRERCTPVNCRSGDLLDTCGTGGDGLQTFNISTAAAIVSAAAGVRVAKHGNRGATSFSGSSDVLQRLGVELEVSPDRVADCVDEIGIGFCFAPLHHSAMKHVANVRRELGLRTIFNLLGPLVNPANARFQLLGTSSNENARLLANAVGQLGRKRAVVVCGNDELDEVSLWGETLALEVTSEYIVEHGWTAKSFGLKACRPEKLRVESSEESASVIRDVLAGKKGPARDIVLANTAAALWTVRRTESLESALGLAAEAIDSGAARRTLARLVKATNAA